MYKKPKLKITSLQYAVAEFYKEMHTKGLADAVFHDETLKVQLWHNFLYKQQDTRSISSASCERWKDKILLQDKPIKTARRWKNELIIQAK